MDLMECVKKTQAVAQAMADRKWDLAVELRGKSFQNNLNTYRYVRVRPRKRPQYFSSRLVSLGLPGDPLITVYSTSVERGGLV